MLSYSFTQNHAMPRKSVLSVLLIIFTCIWFFNLGTRALVPTDEGRYAEMAREMVLSGDFITPRLNAIKYFEKPPLQTWMTALTFNAFGLGEWQARLWTGLCGFFSVLLIALTGARVWNPLTGLYAACALGSMLWWAILGHINTLDMGLSAMLTLSLCGFLLAQSAVNNPHQMQGNTQRQARQQLVWMSVAWAGMALATLSKGLIGVMLPGAVLAAYVLITRDWRLLLQMRWRLGLALYFLICAPWFLLVSEANPEFAHFFFIHEHLERFLSKTHNRAGPWYYFLPLLVGGVLPWLARLPQAMLLPHAEKARARAFRPHLFLLCWAVLIFLFFSASSSKLPSYILPIFPALALLIGFQLTQDSQRALTFLFGSSLLLSIIGLLFLPNSVRFASASTPLADIQTYQMWIITSALLLVAACALALFLLRSKNLQGKHTYAILAYALGAFIAGQILLAGHDVVGRGMGGKALALQVCDYLNAHEKNTGSPSARLPVYFVRMYDQTLPFYLQRTVTQVAHADELAFGLQQEPQLWIPTIEAWKAKWNRDVKAVAIMSPESYTMLKPQLTMREIARDARRVAVVKE